ncbi:MAG: PIN domain-containing protein, partial [Gammaproteobacteria bacterium]
VEYEAVMTRQEHLDASGLSRAGVQELLDAIALVAEPIRLSYLWRPQLPDPQDEMVLETAANGRADVLVTMNRRDFEAAAQTFGVSVISPAEAIHRLGK